MTIPRKKEWFDDDTFWQALGPSLWSEEAFAAAAQLVPLLLRLAKPTGKKVLDLGCGPGRFAIPLAKRGFQVTGVDRTKCYLHKARARVRRAGARVEWIQADMREFVRPDTYDFAISMFTSLGYFDNKEGDVQVVGNLFRSLRAGGVCLIDVMGKEVLARIWQPTTSEVLADGTLSVMQHEVLDDWTRVHNEWHFIRNGKATVYRFHHTIYSGQELRQLLEHAGFVNVQLYGSFSGEDYGLNAKRLIAVARMPVSPRRRMPSQ